MLLFAVICYFFIFLFYFIFYFFLFLLVCAYFFLFVCFEHDFYNNNNNNNNNNYSFWCLDPKNRWNFAQVWSTVDHTNLHDYWLRQPLTAYRSLEVAVLSWRYCNFFSTVPSWRYRSHCDFHKSFIVTGMLRYVYFFTVRWALVSVMCSFSHSGCLYKY